MYFISDLDGEEIDGMFYEKELQTRSWNCNQQLDR